MLGNPSYHQVSHGDVNHRLAALREELIILVQSPVFVQPTECPLHPPPFGQNHQPFHVVGGLDNLETNLARASKLPHPSDEWPRLGAIGPNTAQAGQLMTQKVSKKGGVGGPVALASGYENTYPLPNRPE